jgi:hypothetical protein
MKKMMVFALLAVATLIAIPNASAQTTVIARCNVNGVIYPEDSNNALWAVNSFGNWFVIGSIAGPAFGYTTAVRTDGLTFQAYCR